MHMFKTEEALLAAIVAGQDEVYGPAIHTFKLLSEKRLVDGVFDGDGFFNVIPTPEGGEVADSILIH